MSQLIFKNVLLSLAASTLLLASCQKSAEEAPEPVGKPPRPLSGAEKSTVARPNDFAFRALNQPALQQPPV
ncbi:hypothetical protein [Hymenobacter terrenus]|uniref:hypothetical protein n=1 Tax=Hymenobacter terrenus TaxID=1629124 RepID=UPI0006192F28|nr:hypothetical protein [Hymenobacter terrenus]